MTNTGRQAANAANADLDAGDDAALIARSLHAPECFGVLFDRHAPAIGRYIARRLGPDAADDLVAETFLVAFRRRDHYDLTHGDARPWLYGIATRLIGRHRRQEVRFFRAIARTGVDPAAEAVADQVIDRIAAQACPPGARGRAGPAVPGPARRPAAGRQRARLRGDRTGARGARRDSVVAPGPRAAQGSRGTWRAGPDPPGRGCTVIDEMEQLEQLCAAVPSPDRQRLTAARAQLSTAIRRETAGHAARRPWLAVSLALRHRWLSRRWLGWVAPLAAAAAVTGVILGSQGVFSTGPPSGPELQHPRSGAGPGSPGHRLCGRPVGYGDADPDRHRHRPRPDQDRERPMPGRTRPPSCSCPTARRPTSSPVRCSAAAPAR